MPEVTLIIREENELNKIIMKTQNTIVNRSKFFGLYWGTKTLYIGGVGLVEIGTGGWNLKNLNFYLQLKPLSSIRDEDAVEFFDIVWAKVGTHKDKPIEFKIEFGKEWSLAPTSERYGLVPKGLFHGVDFLRSKGYALPYLDLNIKDLIEYKWITLK